MFRKFMLLAGVVGMVTAAGADTIIPGGNVSGTWAAAGSPFLIMGEITVPSGQTLNIEPGVQVIFQGHYKLIVNATATLNALGTQQDTVSFTAANPSTGWHGIRFLSSDSSKLEYCHLTRGKATGVYPDNHGGAVWSFDSHLIVSHCLFDSNYSSFVGGGIAQKQKSILIDHCSFFRNICSGFEGGGALFIAISHSTITDNSFVENSSETKGGGIYFESDTSIVENNIFIGNTAGIGGGITAGTTSDLQVRNNTFCSNSAYAIQWGNGTTEIVNCILWGNSPNQLAGGFTQVSFCDIQGGYSGTGNIDADPLFIAGPEGDYYLSQIAAGQTQQSPCVDAGDPASPMIDGTTRTDLVQDQGIVDMGYHYNPAFPPPPPPPIDITLTPFNPPIIIPPTGGNLAYTITIDNNTDSLQTPDVWTWIQMPDSSQFPIIGPITLHMPPNLTIFRARDQRIPEHALAGNYIYRGFVGDYPLTIVDSDCFPFIKLASNHEWLGAEGWISSGEPLPGEIAGGGNTPALQGDFTFHISPNPFNPTTITSYELRVASHVSLRIYDTSGRLVQILVDGWREAGQHEVTFDGADLAAGIYFARLEAGEYVGVEKLVLLK